MGGRGLRPKEAGAHVVLDADHVVALPDEVTHGLRANQPPRASDNGNRHFPYSLPPTGASISSASPIRSGSVAIHLLISANICFALRCGRQPSRLKSLLQSEIYTGMSPGLVSCREPMGSSTPVSSRQTSVVSINERLQSRPPPTFKVHPSHASGSSNCRSTKSTRSST